MITLNTCGPQWGLPDASPAAIKAEVLLKMAAVAYRKETHDFLTAQKEKVPFIDDNGNKVIDANFIRLHLETKYMMDFDKGLTQEERAIAWAFEKATSEQIGWLILASQWTDSDNFTAATQELFGNLKPMKRFFAQRKALAQMKSKVIAQGSGNLTKGEISRLAERDFKSLAAFLGNKSFLMGNTPCGADATVFAFLLTALCPRFKSPVRAFAESHPNLRSYCGRMMRRFYPGLLTEDFLEPKSTIAPATLEIAEAASIPNLAPAIADSEIRAN